MYIWFVLVSLRKGFTGPSVDYLCKVVEQSEKPQKTLCHMLELFIQMFYKTVLFQRPISHSFRNRLQNNQSFLSTLLEGDMTISTHQIIKCDRPGQGRNTQTLGEVQIYRKTSQLIQSCSQQILFIPAVSQLHCIAMPLLDCHRKTKSNVCLADLTNWDKTCISKEAMKIVPGIVLLPAALAIGARS